MDVASEHILWAVLHGHKASDIMCGLGYTLDFDPDWNTVKLALESKHRQAQRNLREMAEAT